MKHAGEQGHCSRVGPFGRPAEPDDQALPIGVLAVPVLAEAFEGQAFGGGQGYEFVLGRPGGG